MKRNWPSLNWIMRVKASRHAVGDKKGKMPSMTNINANAGRKISPRLTSHPAVYLPPPRGDFM